MCGELRVSLPRGILVGQLYSAILIITEIRGGHERLGHPAHRLPVLNACLVHVRNTSVALSVDVLFHGYRKLGVSSILLLCFPLLQRNLLLQIEILLCSSANYFLQAESVIMKKNVVGFSSCCCLNTASLGSSRARNSNKIGISNEYTSGVFCCSCSMPNTGQ